MIFNIPLTIVPLALYNLFAFEVFGPLPGDPWTLPVMTVQMVSDARWTLTLGDVAVLTGIAFLFVEIIKATRIGSASLADHFLSMLVFIAYLVEFLLVPQAAHSVFFVLTAIAFVDVVAGYTVTIRTARRDVGIDAGFGRREG